MKSKTFHLRQVHLDFHQSDLIPGIGSGFQKQHWQEKLQEAAVNSITCFAKCHHGWSYHPTKIGKMHPGLDFDLLRAQVEASLEIGIRVQVYVSAGLDCMVAREHPEWIELDDTGRPVRVQPLRPGFDKLCFHSPYLDYLCEQLEEVAELFDDCDGIFLDIINQKPGCSPWAMEYMREQGLNALELEDREKAAAAGLRRYFEKTTAACKSKRGDMPVFHNSGHIFRGRPDINDFQSHFEMESLPTGGWGYDHFPESAAYVAGLGKAYMGMTGKFHSTWGEFGGYKHPNALRYECGAMLAYGAGCSVGDQANPSVQLDTSTYRFLGNAFREVREKEPWCVGAELFARIGVLSCAAERGRLERENVPDTGAVRLLLEEHLPFVMVDRSMDFAPLDLLILPDAISVDEELRGKLEAFLDNGGCLVLSGESGLGPQGDRFALDIGASFEGPSPYEIDYVLPAKEFRLNGLDSPFVHYQRSQRIKAVEGRSLGKVFDPYFNRTYAHFSGHQHAPMQEKPSDYDSAVVHGSVAYFAHPVFSAYRSMGHVTCRKYVAGIIRLLLGDSIQVRTNLPSMGRVTVTRQAEQSRWIVHLLFAPTITRGGKVNVDAGNAVSAGRSIEVIEDLIPLRDTTVSVRMETEIEEVALEPQGEKLSFAQEGGRVTFSVPEFTSHQMIVLIETNKSTV